MLRSNEESSRPGGNWVQEALQNPDWRGDTRMQMSSRKEASMARVDQVGGSRGETVNKDRFSYEGHWFNGAHIHAGAFALPKAVSLSSNESGQKPFSSLGRVCTQAWPLSPSLFTSIHRRSTCTFDHRVQGHRGSTGFTTSLRSEGIIVLRIYGSLLANGLIGSRRLKRL